MTLVFKYHPIYQQVWKLIFKACVMKTIITKHPIVFFCTLNIIISLLIALLSGSFNNTPQWAVGLFAILIILFIKGKVDVYKLIKSTLFRCVNLKWYLAALMLPILFCSLSYVAISFIEYKELIDLEFNHSVGDYAVLVLLMLLGSYCEELGWRGFMLPQLLKKYSLFVSTLLIGMFWGIWHLNITLGISVSIIYLILVIEFSFISSWLYIQTKQDLLAIIILHTSIDICSVIFFERFVMAEIMDSQSMTLLYGIVVISFSPMCIRSIKYILINRNFKTKE